MSDVTPNLIDENTDLAIAPSYDPLRQGTFDEYVQITTRVNPGKRKFNNIAGQVTHDRQVLGLVLYWGDGAKDTRLRELVGVKNTERLTLYADTVIIDEPVRFPGTHVTIHARRLIVGKKGSIDTTPEPFVIPAAQGGTPPDKMRHGEDGDAAGDVDLFVQSAEIAPGAPRFTLKGSAGQGGQKGGYLPRKEAKQVPPWQTILDTILDHDVLRGTAANWKWMPDLERHAKPMDFTFLHLQIRNTWVDEKPKVVAWGDIKAENPGNGLDAYASGAGGNGGRGGTFRMLGDLVPAIPAAQVVVDGGAKGTSEFSPGTSKAANAKVMYRGAFNVCHTSSAGAVPPKQGPKDYYPSRWGWGDATPRDGNGAQGKDGEPGEKGSIEKITDGYWLHPLALETVLQYARNAWLKGDRKPARWLLPKYQAALRDGKFAKAMSEDLVLGNLGAEVDRLLVRVEENLDYFGNPVGWVPRLSALTNIEILKTSGPALLKQLTFAAEMSFKADEAEKRAEHLAYLLKELENDIAEARDALVDAQTELPKVKSALDDVDRKLKQTFLSVHEIEAEAVGQLKIEAAEQAIFTGACQLVGGLCHFIPVGQPIVGQVASGVLEQISKIQLHGDKPFGNLQTTGEIVSSLGKYVDKYQDEITNSLNSNFRSNIDTAKAAVDKLDEKITKQKEDLAEAKRELESRFGDDLAILRTRLEKLRAARSLSEAKFYDSNEYAEMIRYSGAIEKEIAVTTEIDPQKKAEIQTKLAALKKDKEQLTKNIEGWETAKTERGDSIKNASKYIQSVGTGIGEVAGGLRAMMVPADTTSDAFKKKLEALKDSKYKRRIDWLNSEVSRLNAERMSAVNRAIMLEGVIVDSCETIKTGLLRSAQLSDERGEETSRQLKPMTRLFLRRMAQDAWEVLRAEMYYLVKSYQYRFLRRADPETYDPETIIRDIEKFFTSNNIREPKEDDFRKAFDAVIQSLLLRLALELLTNRIQNLSDPHAAPWQVVLGPSAETIDGRKVLEELSANGRVSFRLHELKGPDRKGTGKEHFYRLRKVTFKEMAIRFSEETKQAHPGIEERISLRVVLAHSGDSVIRDEYDRTYFFTTRNPASSMAVIQNVRTWGAVYNGTEGLTNEEVSTSDADVLVKLLSDLGKTTKLQYEEHLPGATSLLTLSIKENDLGVPFTITKLVFDVYHEMVTSAPARRSAALRSHQPPSVS